MNFGDEDSLYEEDEEEIYHGCDTCAWNHIRFDGMMHCANERCDHYEECTDLATYTYCDYWEEKV